MVHRMVGGTCDSVLTGFSQCLVGLVTRDCLDGVQTVLGGTCDSVTKGFRECLMILVAQS